MPITLLFDLDDTLLDTNIDVFIPAYFKALSGALADIVAQEVMFSALTGGTKAMMLNTDPSKSLREVFDAYFFPKLGVGRSILQERIDHFYDEIFPTLGSVTKPIPEAIRLVDWAFEQGHRVVIATNPLFPLKAIHQRLCWAGLPPEKYPFALVTSYETFHFTKEGIAYYPEILAQLGWPEDPVVVVGDDIEREVKPTRAVGFPVFWVRKLAEFSTEQNDVPQGTLASFRDWLEGTDPDTLMVSLGTPQALLANLRSTPAALATLTSSLSSEVWAHKLVSGEWCPIEIVCHLRDVEREINYPRICKLLDEDEPFIAGATTDNWAEERQYAKQDGHRALVEFIEARKKTLSLLDGLQGEWTRTARHAETGPMTLKELVSSIASHDRVHDRQLWKTIKSC